MLNMLSLHDAIYRTVPFIEQCTPSSDTQLAVLSHTSSDNDRVSLLLDTYTSNLETSVTTQWLLTIMHACLLWP